MVEEIAEDERAWARISKQIKQEQLERYSGEGPGGGVLRR